MLNKTDLRRTLIAARHAVATEVRAEWDASIAAHVRAWCAANPIQTLGVYWPLQGEPDLRAVYADLATRDIRLALPVVVRRDAPLEFAIWTPGDTLTKDAHGVPAPATPANAVRPDALLIPCVGFNAQRIRLGYGAGYYDRTLAATPRPVTVGIAYACAMAAFGAASHDIALDTIITERSSGLDE